MKKLEKLKVGTNLKKRRREIKKIKKIVSRLLPIEDQTGDPIKDKKIAEAYSRGQLVAMGLSADYEEAAIKRAEEKRDAEAGGEANVSE